MAALARNHEDDATEVVPRTDEGAMRRGPDNAAEELRSERPNYRRGLVTDRYGRMSNDKRE